MPYLPRMFRPDAIYFITSRTVDGNLFLRPSAQINDVIGGVLADAQKLYDIELFDYVFLSNHMHLAVRGRPERIARFMQYVKANIATGVNATLGRHGPVWERRYQASPILDEGAQAERATYIYGHGVKEGLVDRAVAWPGVASTKERLTGRRQHHRRVDRTGLARARCNHKAEPREADFARRIEVKLSPWPFLAGCSRRAQRRRVAALVAHAESQAREARQGRGALGVRRILAQSPWSRPSTELERRPNPLCHTTDPRQRRSYREEFARFLEAYREASLSLREGNAETFFPPNSFRPPLPHAWRAKRPASPRAGPRAGSCSGT